TSTSTLHSMGTMLRALIAASLIFAISECSMKWDAKLGKNTIADSEQLDRPPHYASAKNAICHWEGCDPGPYCSAGVFIGRSQRGYNKYAGQTSFCWLGINYLCCNQENVKKDPGTNCKIVDRLWAPHACDGYEIQVEDNGGWTCCMPGTIVE
ncbi:hypothetical protein PENTCL1PPCAC_826, partial [Pristionchus entomophagus]